MKTVAKKKKSCWLKEPLVLDRTSAHLSSAGTKKYALSFAAKLMETRYILRCRLRVRLLHCWGQHPAVHSVQRAGVRSIYTVLLRRALLEVFKELKFYILTDYIEQIPCSEANSGSAGEQNNPSVIQTESLPQYKLNKRKQFSRITIIF